MAGKGRASVNDMKRVEVLVLMEIDQQTEDNGGPYGFSRKTLAERVGVSPYRARAAIDRLDSEGMIDVVSRYSDDGGQLANGICLTERGEWYLEGVHNERTCGAQARGGLTGHHGAIGHDHGTHGTARQLLPGEGRRARR